MTTCVARIELDEVKAADNTQAEPLITRDLNLVGHVLVELTVEVGHAEMSVDELFALRAGDVVKTLQQVNQPMTLRLNGKAVALGSLVAVDDNFGFQIREIVS